jgi:putative membrane protein
MHSVVELLPHVNASLNALAAVLLIAGYVTIKRRQEAAHKWLMLACFAVSIVFLACYLTYHAIAGSKHFPTYPPRAVQVGYKLILLTHIVLAATVPFLAAATIWLGLTDRRRAHVRLAWWTFPIWLYVSVTGIVVYVMLYQLYPPVP